MDQFTPAEKLIQGIARVQILSGLADEAGAIAPPPYCETLAQIRELAVAALLILNSLRGQVGGAP